MPVLPILLSTVAWGQAVEVRTNDGVGTPQLRLRFGSGTGVTAVQILNARLTFGSSGYFTLPYDATGDTTAGGLYYDSVTGRLRYRDGTGTRTLTLDGGSAYIQNQAIAAQASASFWIDGAARVGELRTGPSAVLRIDGFGVGELIRLSLVNGANGANTLNVLSTGEAPVTLNVAGNSVTTGRLIQASGTGLTTGTLLEATVPIQGMTGDILYIHDDSATPATKLRLTATGDFSTISTSATAGSRAISGTKSTTIGGTGWSLSGESSFAGVYGEAGPGTASYHAGVLGYLIGGGANSGGVVGLYSSTVWGGLGYVDNSTNPWAGYFNGHVGVKQNSMTVELNNGSGGLLIAGHVVIANTAADLSVTTTTLSAHPGVLGVVVYGGPAAATVSIGVDGIVSIEVDGATNRGDYLITSALPGRARSTPTAQTGVFAIALTSTLGAGTVKALMIRAENF